MRTTYNDTNKKTTINASIDGLSFDQYIDLCRYLRALKHQGGDPLNDATRPSGTPKSERQRQLEDAAALAEGELTVTHAAGGTPVIVAKADEPVGVHLPAEETLLPTEDAEAFVASGQDDEPDPQPKQKRSGRKPPPRVSELKAATEEKDPDEEKAEHAQRWRGKNTYGAERVVGFAVKGVDFTVVLELESGEKVWLDDNDVEIKREPVKDELPPHEAAAGDFRPDYDSKTPQPPQEPPAAPLPPEDLPNGVTIATKVREIVMPFVERRDPDGRGKEFASLVIEDVVKAAPHIKKFQGMDDNEVRKRVVQVLAVLAVLNHEQLGEMKASLGV